jgi:hypothetical protein
MLSKIIRPEIRANLAQNWVFGHYLNFESLDSSDIGVDC